MNRKINGFLGKVVLFSLILFIASVSSVSAKPVVGLVMKSLANEFFKTMEEGARKFAAADGSFTLIPVGMNSETDIDTQVAAMDNFIARKVDLIVIAPSDSVGMVASVKKAINAGIPVINIDVTLDKKALKEAGLPENFLFVGPDNAEGAELVGDCLAKSLGAGGKVVIIEGMPGADNAKQRKEGFLRSIKKGRLNLIASTTAHWETEEANTVVTNLLTAHPDIKGIMCANDSMALGAARAIEAAGRKDIKIVGFDNIAAVQDLIKQGKVLATVDQFGGDLAANAIKIGLELLQTGAKANSLTGWQKTPVKLITIDNLKK